MTYAVTWAEWVGHGIRRESSKFPFSLARARRDCPKTSEIVVWRRSRSATFVVMMQTAHYTSREGSSRTGYTIRCLCRRGLEAVRV